MEVRIVVLDNGILYYLVSLGLYRRLDMESCIDRGNHCCDNAALLQLHKDILGIP